MVLDVMFPPRCLGCSERGVALCARCAESVGVIVPPLCARCGRPWPAPLPTCRDCPPEGIDLARSPFLYEGPIAAAIRGMKFGGWRALAPRLAAAIAAVLPEPPVADAVCWVPLSARRRRRRGFDQAEVLARALADLLALPAVRALHRRRDTPEQARLSGARRRAVLVGVFRPRRRAPPTLLLVDDVLTTGATAAACAAALRDGGAQRVVVATAARAVRGPVPAGTYGGSRSGHPGL